MDTLSLQSRNRVLVIILSFKGANPQINIAPVPWLAYSPTETNNLRYFYLSWTGITSCQIILNWAAPQVLYVILPSPATGSPTHKPAHDAHSLLIAWSSSPNRSMDCLSLPSAAGHLKATLPQILIWVGSCWRRHRREVYAPAGTEKLHDDDEGTSSMCQPVSGGGGRGRGKGTRSTWGAMLMT